MLLNFTVSNWRSIRNEVTLSMQATREQNHGDRLTKLKKFNTRVLPNAVLFGPNASGKSSFIAAMEFVQDLVLNWDKRFLLKYLEPYKLDRGTQRRPSEFTFQLYIDGYIYDYFVACTRNEITAERLVKSNSSSSYVLFDRRGQQFTFDRTRISEDALQRLEAIKLGTDRSQPLLNNVHGQKLDTFDDVYNWFDNALVIIHPFTRFSRLQIFNSEEIIDLYNRWLPYLDTGIKRIEKEEVSAKESSIPEEELEFILNVLMKRDKPADGSVVVNRNFILIETHVDAEPNFSRLITIHEGSDGKDISLNLDDESDGTRRLLDLIPAFCAKMEQDTTFVIDEVDRSLHSMLTIALFRSFHERCGEDNFDQIIATSHDLELMNQKYFRRDEMWFFERDKSGSNLVPFSDFETKKDKDIRRMYQEGRMGGLPNLQFEQIDGEGEE